VLLHKKLSTTIKQEQTALLTFCYNY